MSDKSNPRYLYRIGWTFIVKHRKALLLLAVFLIPISLVSSPWFRGYWNSNANTVGQNYIIEFFANLLFPIVPLAFGISFGKRIKELEFYNDLERVLDTLVELRTRDLIYPNTVRHLVKTIVNSFGNEAVKQQWLERAAQSIHPLRINNKEECRVCTLEASVGDNKCTFCQLNCYAWDFSKLKGQEIQNEELNKVVEMDSVYKK
jgi:hypothetical protein